METFKNQITQPEEENKVEEVVRVEKSENDKKNWERTALAMEIIKSEEIFPFTGLKQENYSKMKAINEEFPGYSTPIDEIINRCKKEGMKVVLGGGFEGGNIFILPAGSNDIENDSILLKHLNVDNGGVSDGLRKLVTMCS